MGKDLKDVGEGTMWISGEQCSRKSKDSRSRYGVDMGAHLVCSRNIREASVVDVEETRGRVADELREALGAKPP